ncbi:MAG TPA: helix-turn-helix transcriptional regulator [Candidatus Limnocylindria bacterium]|nr:helix-turn-helix transcriptional regulator [Candidatus Limnocylindria bacterium]
MRDDVIGRVIRALRHRRGWRQVDLSRAAGVSRAVLSDLEAGRLDRHSLGALRAAITAAGGHLRFAVDVPGGELERLLDADHAHLQNRWKRWLEQHGWLVEAEVTFNHFGERGSVDLLAFHPGRRVLLVVEIKSVLVDVQLALSTLDRKVRISEVLARERTWQPIARIPVLAIREGSTARRRVAHHASLFGRFDVRGRTAVGWLMRPRAPTPTGILMLTKSSDARPGDARRAGRQRVRAARRHSRSAGTSSGRRMSPGQTADDSAPSEPA